MFSARLNNLPPFSSNLELSSANSFGLEEFEICRLMVEQMMNFVFDKIENVLGKGETAQVTSISPFSTLFSKTFFLTVVKSWDYVGKT